MTPVRFGHQIPVKALRPMNAQQLEQLNQTLQAMDPHIKGLVALKTLKGESSDVQTNDRLIIRLRDNDTVKRQQAYTQWKQQQELSAQPPRHAFQQEFEHQPIVVEADKSDTQQSWWQKLVSAYKHIMKPAEPIFWRMRYYASGSTVWEMVANTVTQVQNRLLEDERNLGIQIDWPSRPLPYEWRGFMARPAHLSYPLHHNERLTDPTFWPPNFAKDTAINPTYPVVPYYDTNRFGPNALQVGYPYVHETFTPPTGRKPPVVATPLKQLASYHPPGVWVWLTADKPVSVLAIIQKLGQLTRQHKVSTVFNQSLQGLPTHTTMLSKGKTLRVFMGNRGLMDWQLLPADLERDLNVLKLELDKLGLVVKQVTVADPFDHRYDVDNSLEYDRLKAMLPHENLLC